MSYNMIYTSSLPSAAELCSYFRASAACAAASSAALYFEGLTQERVSWVIPTSG